MAISLGLDSQETECLGNVSLPEVSYLKNTQSLIAYLVARPTTLEKEVHVPVPYWMFSPKDVVPTTEPDAPVLEGYVNHHRTLFRGQLNVKTAWLHTPWHSPEQRLFADTASARRTDRVRLFLTAVQLNGSSDKKMSQLSLNTVLPNFLSPRVDSLSADAQYRLAQTQQLSLFLPTFRTAGAVPTGALPLCVHPKELGVDVPKDMPVRVPLLCDSILALGNRRCPFDPFLKDRSRVQYIPSDAFLVVCRETTGLTEPSLIPTKLKKGGPQVDQGNFCRVLCPLMDAEAAWPGRSPAGSTNPFSKASEMGVAERHMDALSREIRTAAREQGLAVADSTVALDAIVYTRPASAKRSPDKAAVCESLLRVLSDLMVQQEILSAPVIPHDLDIDPQLLCVVVARADTSLGKLPHTETMIDMELLHNAEMAKVFRPAPILARSQFRVPRGRHYIVQLRRADQSPIAGLGHCIILSAAGAEGAGTVAALYTLLVLLLDEEPFLKSWTRSQALPDSLLLGVTSGQTYSGPSVEDFVHRVGSGGLKSRGSSSSSNSSSALPVGPLSPVPQAQPSPAPSSSANSRSISTQTLDKWSLAKIPAEMPKYRRWQQAYLDSKSASVSTFPTNEEHLWADSDDPVGMHSD